MFSKLKQLPELELYSQALQATLGDAAKLAAMELLYVPKLSRQHTQKYGRNKSKASTNARRVWGASVLRHISADTIAAYCEALGVPIENSKEESESVEFLLHSELLITELRIGACRGDDLVGGLDYLLPTACDAFDDSASVQVLLDQRWSSVTTYVDEAEHLLRELKDRETHVKSGEVVTVGNLAHGKDSQAAKQPNSHKPTDRARSFRLILHAGIDSNMAHVPPGSMISPLWCGLILYSRLSVH